MLFSSGLCGSKERCAKVWSSLGHLCFQQGEEFCCFCTLKGNVDHSVGETTRRDGGMGECVCVCVCV